MRWVHENPDRMPPARAECAGGVLAAMLARGQLGARLIDAACAGAALQRAGLAPIPAADAREGKGA